MGTPEFALPTLEMLCAHYPVVGVVTQPDRRAGRGRRLVTAPVKQLAVAEGIPVFQPDQLRCMAAVERVRAWSPDLIVVAAFGQILPTSILELARFGVLNIHPSLLPRWRGAAPIPAALMAGDTVTGVTVMRMDAGLDTGPILAQRETPIQPLETAGELEERLAHLGAALLQEILPDYLEGQLQPQPQPDEGVTVVHRFKKDVARLDWERPAVELANQVRALSPRPGAYTLWEHKRLKILLAKMLPAAGIPAAAPGAVFVWDGVPVVVTGEGCLALLRLQMAGKRPMDGGVFLRGKQGIVGAILGPPEPGD